MPNSTITHENKSGFINVLANQRNSIFSKAWAEGGRDFTSDEQDTLDAVNNFLLCADPQSRADAGAVLETAIEQLQLFNHGDPDINLEAVEASLFKVLRVLSVAGDYRPAFCAFQGAAAAD